MDSYVVAVEGLDALQRFDELPGKIQRIATAVVNRTAERAKAEGARRIRDQVAFPARYLTGRRGRLSVTKKASNSELEAIVTGQHRPTSLARFAGSRNPSAARKRGGVNVEVKPGESQFMGGAFLIKLPQGKTGVTDTQFNLGLAIRLKPGESVRNKRRMVEVSKGLYLLYGPSVDQVFRTVAGDITPDMEDWMETEFTRLVDLDLFKD